MLSYVENIPSILEAAKPYRSILDAGPGMGKYGLLLREQYMSLAAEAGDMQPNIFTLRVDAAEITPYFYKMGHVNLLYDNVLRVSFMDVPSLDITYDLVMLIDVVEHYPKEAIKQWLENVKNFGTPPDVLISTPKVTHMYTEHYYGDPNHHQSQWELSDFKVKKDFSTELSHIVIV